METGDGLLVRVRVSGGRLTLDQAAAITEAALACGNGAMTLSGRGNLQVRGVSERTLLDLHRRLEVASLIDPDAEVERLRNIVASPLSDIDPEAPFDLSLHVAALEAALAEDQSLRALPSKFSFVLDAQGRLPVGDLHADIRFEAAHDKGAPSFAIYLGGEDSLAAICATAEVGGTATRLSRAFLSLAGAGEARRMRTLVDRVGAKAVFAEAGLEASPRPRSRGRTSLSEVLGTQLFAQTTVVGAAAPFGGIDARLFGMLVERVQAVGANGIRLTPWRSFFVAGLAPPEAESFLAACEELGFIVRPGDPRLRVVGCPGAPACMHAHRPLRHDATRWSALLPKGDGVILHLSGCAKGCARPFTTAATLVATETGYDLVIAGKAGDIPARRGLSSAAVDALLANEGANLFEGERSAG
jgi:precorrin-3B synthase